MRQRPEPADGKCGSICDTAERLRGKIIWGKPYLRSIGEGDNYSVIQKVVCACITEYEIFPENKDYQNHFRFYNPENRLYFEDIPEDIYTIELPKLPSQPDGTGLWDWLRFLKAKTKEEFEMVAERNPEIRKAVNTLYEISADDEVRALYEHRLKARLDRNSEMHGAMMDGRLGATYEIARNFKTLGAPIEQIAKATGLSVEIINDL